MYLSILGLFASRGGAVSLYQSTGISTGPPVNTDPSTMAVELHALIERLGIDTTYWHTLTLDFRRDGNAFVVSRMSVERMPPPPFRELP